MTKLSRRSLLAFGAASIGAVGLAACSNGDEGVPGADKSGPVEVKKVGLMLQDVSNPFFASMQTVMEKEAESQGFELNVQDGRQDLGQQNTQIDTFIQQGMNLIILNAVDSKGIGSAVTRAKQAGIIVVAVDVDAEGADAAVTTDNVAAGTQAMQALADKIGGKGKIFILEGTPTTAPQERAQGAADLLKEKYPDIEVLAKQAGQNDRASGLALTTDMLTAHADVNGIFAINDPEALGADLAIQQANLKDIPVVGVDGSPEAVEALKNGSSNLWASSAQDPAGMVVKALEVGKEIASGKKPAERVTLLTPSIVTRDTVGEYKGW